MENYFFLEKHYTKIYGPIPENDLVSAYRFFKKGGFKVTRIPEPPPMELIRRWRESNIGQATDGCEVEGWCSCEHGYPSWLRIFKDFP